MTADFLKCEKRATLVEIKDISPGTGKLFD